MTCARNTDRKRKEVKMGKEKLIQKRWKLETEEDGLVVFTRDVPTDDYSSYDERLVITRNKVSIELNGEIGGTPIQCFREITTEELKAIYQIMTEKGWIKGE